MTTRTFLLAGLGTLFFVSGCARPVTSTTTTTAAAMPQPTAEPPSPGLVHGLVIQTASCWLGGMWSDALGEQGDARDAGIRHRCFDVIQAVGGPASISYYPLRAVDAAMVGQLAGHLRRFASEDATDAPHVNQLVSLLMHVADAARENVRARRAADDVKLGYEANASTEERAAAKVAAASKLQESRGLHALLDGASAMSPYEDDARGIGLMIAIDRMVIAQGLPKHLKVYALGGALSDVFGVPPPRVSEEAEEPLPTGTWLAYLSRVAEAAGHPVPADARDPHNLEHLAWAGTLQGFADRLRGLRAEPSLDAVSKRLVQRIDDEVAGVHAAYARLAPSAK